MERKESEREGDICFMGFGRMDFDGVFLSVRLSLRWSLIFRPIPVPVMRRLGNNIRNPPAL